MAAATFSHRAPVPCDSTEWVRFLTEEGSKYLEFVSGFVYKHKDQCLPLKNPPGSVLRIAPLQHTIYRDQPEEVNGWGKFYLPEIVKMQVLGVVEGTSSPSDELVLMTCEDKKVYGFDGEELHEVAQDPYQLKTGEINYPSDTTYYNGQAFEYMTEEDWEKVKRGPVGQKLAKEHKKLVEANKSAFLENLKSQK